MKFSTWRRLWIALAEAEKELGIDIRQEQIDQMKANVENIDYALAQKKEKSCGTTLWLTCIPSGPPARTRCPLFI